MTFEEIQGEVAATAEEIWIKVGNLNLPQEMALVFIRGALCDLLGKQAHANTQYLKSITETVEEIREDAQAVRRLIQEKDARIGELESENVELRENLAEASKMLMAIHTGQPQV